MIPTNPDWQDNDLFKMSKMERDRMKENIARRLGLPIRHSGTGPVAPVWAHEVSGIQPFTPQNAEAALKKFTDEVGQKPKKGSSEPDEDFQKRLSSWTQNINSKCSWSTVINATQMSWESPSGPWNVGYIEHLSDKIKDGQMQWDCTIERKAGGMDTSKTPDFTSINLTLANSASAMALIRIVVGEVKRKGDCSDDLKRNFMSLRITWLFTASKDEIINLSMQENISQHQRRRHTEFDNVFQVKMWMDTMPSLPGKSLDPKKAIDVVKYALVMGNPLKPHDTPGWLTNMLKGKEPTMENKLAVVSKTSGFTKQFIADNMITIEHPEMKSYQRVVQRVRAVVGFCAWEELHEIWQEISRRGFANRPCPLTSALLLDPKILTSAGMANKAEADNVPLWRDGQRGKELQRAMVEVARTRLFEHKVIESLQSTKSLFPSGHAWASFARLNGPPHYFLDGVYQQHFGSSEAWSDSIKSSHKALWIGEYDQEIAKLGSVLPSQLDGQPTQMKSQLANMFPPVAHLVHTQQQEAYQLQSSKQRQEEERKKKEEEDKKQKDVETKEDVTSIQGVSEDGDVTDQVCPGADSTAKKKLCDTLNAQEKKRREESLSHEILLANAAVLRHRLTVVDSLASAKLFMESTTKEGLKARCLYIDLPQHNALLSKGRWAKTLLHQPEKKWQEELAQQVLAAPMVPIVGTVVMRTGGVNMWEYHQKIGNKMSQPRTLFVPIDLPPQYEKFVKSGARRALGPISDHNDRSGVMFSMTSVGAHENAVRVEEATTQGNAEQSSDEEIEDMEERDAEVEVAGTSIETMTPSQMKNKPSAAAL